MRNYENYDAYRLSIELCGEVYRVTKAFPSDERRSLTAQLRRAAVSVPSNLAEGAGRWSPKDFARFVDIALGSVNEVRAQTQIGHRLGYVSQDDLDVIFRISQTVRKQLVALRRTLRPEAEPQHR